jgi:hypothetical protein
MTFLIPCGDIYQTNSMSGKADFTVGVLKKEFRELHDGRPFLVENHI